MVNMNHDTSAGLDGCPFCDISAGRSRASVVHEDELLMVLMDLNPVTRGHLLVVPRVHAVGLEDTDIDISAHVWTVGHMMARVLRRSTMDCEGINVLLCDGEVAFQTVPHFHLHVIPRYTGDGWTIKPDVVERDRSLLDSDAAVVRAAIASPM
jgi:diadenosine tetraphosphate (Ap4A) HIT family hydrolase